MYLTKATFNASVDSLNSRYWKEGRKYRWQYIEHVIDIMKICGAKNTLEAGTYYIPLNSDSFLVELEQKMLVNKRGQIMDLNITPYPFKDKFFDCAVALQVWEHLDNQAAAFQELCRISKNIILSFPYKWTWGDARHRGIDDKKIEKWTCGVKPDHKKLINHRMICYWRIS